MKKIRTRYAPSPTGNLHIGGARTALFCYLFAKNQKGDFIIRFEDTDLTRNIKAGEKSQLDNLKWLGIIPDESPLNPKKKYGSYRQSEKLDRYHEITNILISKGHAYKAYDSSEELEKQRKEQKRNGILSFRYDKKWLNISNKEKIKRDKSKEYSIRLSLPANKEYKWNDIVRGDIIINTKDIGDYIITKKNGYPTYNFASVIDDFDMKISHVLRGEEHITNTPKQLIIYDLMNWDAPKFGHLTIITNMQGKKLSKRDLKTKQFIEDYKNKGYIPESIFNFLSLLGWTAEDASEINSKKELIKKINLKRLSKSPSKFDIKKMQWFSKQYLKTMNNKKIIEIMQKKINIKHLNKNWLKLFIETYKQNSTTINDIINSLNIYNDKYIRKTNFSQVVSTFKSELLKNPFTIKYIQQSINKTKEITGIVGKDLFLPIRLETTYQKHGPELSKAIFLVGENIIKKRLANV